MASPTDRPASEVVIDLTEATEVPSQIFDWQAEDPIPEPTDFGDPNEQPPTFPTEDGDFRDINDLLKPPSAQEEAETDVGASQADTPSTSTSTAKRKRSSTASAARPVRKKKPSAKTLDAGPPLMTTNTKKLRITFTTEMTARIMEWFQACKNRCMFNSTKKADYTTVWDEVWKLFLTYSGVTKPIGKRAVYEAVFFRERATCGDIAEPGEVPATQATQEAGDVDDDDSGRDNISQLDQGSSEEEEEEEEGDEDQGEAGTPINTPTPVRGLGDSLVSAATLLAAPQLPGSEDFARAVGDLQAGFGDVLNAEELDNCFNQLQKELLNSVKWNRLNKEMKQYFVNRWKDMVT
ncbi:hypothetical protein B0T24DRAFT_593074 [Lasiosphaeria ovina]|uniref:Uncharacterized protein n=1 Tax=Lasiosphaeria ovina TaxID=92902 RepID=A0AAE0N7C6_9PEZI|nr:hypothetical protein B0T24DRAFT_593074 [Lasiosphaeria ovina]